MAKKPPLYPHVPKGRAKSRLDVLREILAAKTVEEVITLKGKYLDVELTSDDVEEIDKHIASLGKADTSVARAEVKANYYYCDNTRLHSNNEVIQIKTEEENPRCPYCDAVMTYGRYWGPLLSTKL